MTKKMHAAFVERFGTPLVTMEVDVPTPGPGQILVKTGLRCLPHRPSRRDRRLAAEAEAPIHPWS
jgi:hypothetical protein